MVFVLLLSSEEVGGTSSSMSGREREREKEQNEKIPDPSIHQSIPSIYLLADFVCLVFFLLPVFFPFSYLTLPYLTLPYYTAVYLDCFLVFELELELELGFEVR